MAIRKAQALTITFDPVDSSARPARKSVAGYVAGDTKVSKDGAAFSSTTNTPAEIGSTGRYSLSLTAAEMNADWVHVYAEHAGVDPVDLRIGTKGDPTGSVVSDAGNTSSTFKTDRTEATADYWKDNLLVFTSGNLRGQVKKITAYDGTTKFVTLSGALTAAPSAADLFVLLDM